MDADLAVVASPSALLQPDGPRLRGRLQIGLAQLKLLFDPLGTVAGRFAQFGDAYRVQLAGGTLYVFRHPDHIRDVLITNASAFDKQHTAFQRLSIVLGDALLTSDGERWRRQRRLVQPAFSRARLAQYSTAMVEEAVRTRDELARGGRFDLSREMNSLTLRIVTRTLFGETFEGHAQSRAAILALGRWFTTPPQLLRLLPGRQRRFDRAVAALDGVIERLISSKRSRLVEEPGGASDLLSALLLARGEQGETLGAQELRDQLLTLYLAGHETTSHALTWTLYLLSQHPEARAKLDAELDLVLGGRAPEFEDLAALRYSEQVIKEALRLYPPAFVLPRRACQDTSVGPYRIPKGSEVILWTFHTHRDSRFYPEPERFRPERFAPDEEAARPKCAYLPFGAGQRACIGQQFAMIEAQLILATLLPRLRFEYAGSRPPRPLPRVTLAARGGMPMRARPR